MGGALFGIEDFHPGGEYRYANDLVPMDRMVASWIQTGLVHLLFIYGYVVSRRLVPQSEAPSG